MVYCISLNLNLLYSRCSLRIVAFSPGPALTQTGLVRAVSFVLGRQSHTRLGNSQHPTTLPACNRLHRLLHPPISPPSSVFRLPPAVFPHLTSHISTYSSLLEQSTRRISNILMIASNSIGTTAKLINTHHGNPSTVTSSSYTMDLHNHQSHSHSLGHPRVKDPDAMNTLMDRGPDDAHYANHTDARLNEPAPVPQDAQAVLERPRDEEGRASVVDRQGKDLNRPFGCCHFISACVG